MAVLLLASCGSFGEGFLAGIGNMGGYSYGGNSYMATANAGNMNYLLDPNYAVAQTMYNPQNEMLAFCKTKCSIRKTKRILLRVPS